MQEGGLSRGRGARSASARRSSARLVLLVDGRRVALEPAGAPRLSFPAGAGGLRTTRLELPLRARGRRPAPGRAARRHLPRPVGWKAVVSAPGRGHRGAHRRSERRPHRRPAPLPGGPPVQPARPRARPRFRVEPGDGTLVAPEGRGRRRRRDARGVGRLRRPVRGRRLRARACCCSCCWRAFGWGALHALSPGHGKAMVAAYLVGTRGSRAARRRARRDGHGHAHDRRVRARRRDARAVPVRAAGGPLPLADAGLRPAGRRDRRRRAARADAQGARTTHAHHHHAARPRARPELEGPARHGRRPPA